ncbi:MAG: motility-associated protein [Myxococcota bacterium]
MDPLSLIGLVLGLVTVFATQLAEGGALGVLFQGPAAVIVGLGTLGATLLSASASDLTTAARESKRIFRRAADRREPGDALATSP